MRGATPKKEYNVYMRNNAHMETKEARLDRFMSNPPEETIETLLNSIANFFNNEIALTPAPDNRQTSLLFLGIHAVALTISEAFFGKKGADGYKLFLEKFIDQTPDNMKFSLIAREIHDWRNVLAHQWLGSIGHHINYDYDMPEGWKKDEDGVLKINPKIYCEHYLKAFSSSGNIWRYGKIFSREELEGIKRRIIEKYINR